jgi:hypothetical protein
MQNLKSDFFLIDPNELCRTLERRGFRLLFEQRRSLPAGKGFWTGLLGRQ